MAFWRARIRGTWKRRRPRVEEGPLTSHHIKKYVQGAVTVRLKASTTIRGLHLSFKNDFEAFTSAPELTYCLSGGSIKLWSL